ncbi:uncharacterized protein BDW47DRAFT_106280 [Aspergillus candidus]|uniref:Uncharacterized protein n=1 Tax=Aspergillus candidus TaxID=41067 RepID=A0A2I2FAV1_ASPCN|nr:hypothetical protein BDW47DRAFT_106280 [Aspergillus candidus]PLB37761.1 hypothetical protein BDW47DRAFT_106280 [Aspergillus candidus]
MGCLILLVSFSPFFGELKIGGGVREAWVWRLGLFFLSALLVVVCRCVGWLVCFGQCE